MNEEAVIKASFKELPDWVNFRSLERAEWVNCIVSELWPYISDTLANEIKSFEPTVRSMNLTLILFYFSKIKMGKIAPRVTGIKAYK